MAVFQGARQRTMALPARAVERGARDVPASTRSARPRATTMLLAGVLAATMFGLVYLTQTLGANATSAQIAQLQVSLEKGARKVTSQTTLILTMVDPDDVGRRAKELGLVRLGDTLTLSAP
jgi:hypothetical protein